MKIALLGDSDSQIFAMLSLYDTLIIREDITNVDFYLDANQTYPKNIYEELQKRNIDVQQYIWGVLDIDVFSEYQALGVFLAGSKLYTLRKVLEKYRRNDLFLFCGFNGVVYEKFEEGIAWRLGYDAICLNGPRDIAQFAVSFGGTPYENQCLVSLGLRRGGALAESVSGVRGKTAVFAEQIVVPATKKMRRHLYQLLKILANENSSWKVVVRPRLNPGEKSFHQQVLPLRDIYLKDDSRPSNLVFDERPLSSLLNEAKVLLTISSTAVFDAVGYGVTPVVITNFGLKNINGSHFFIGCGAERYLNEGSRLDEFLDIKLNRDWLDRVSGDRCSGTNNLLQTIKAGAKKNIDISDLFLQPEAQKHKFLIRGIKKTIIQQVYDIDADPVRAYRSLTTMQQLVLDKQILGMEINGLSQSEIEMIKPFEEARKRPRTYKFISFKKIMNGVSRFLKYNLGLIRKS